MVEDALGKLYWDSEEDRNFVLMAGLSALRRISDDWDALRAEVTTYERKVASGYLRPPREN